MREQLSLFEAATKHWVEHVWEGVGEEQRAAVFALLAQMAASQLAQPPATPTKEADDES